MTPYTIGFDVSGTGLKSGGVTQQAKLLAQGVASSGANLGPEVLQPSKATAKSAKNAKEPLAELLYGIRASGAISRDSRPRIVAIARRLSLRPWRSWRFQ